MIGHSEYELKRKWEGWWWGGCDKPGVQPRGRAARGLSSSFGA